MVYEVRCYDCNVSFPPDTKKCFYCGKRPSAEPPGAVPSFLRAAPAGAPAGGPPSGQGPEPTQEEIEQEMSGRSPFAFGSTGLWIAVALGAAVMRMCSG